MTIFDALGVGAVKGLAYGVQSKPTDSVHSGTLFRLERGTPYYRRGSLVYAVPQFRAMNLFSPTSKNALLPTITVTPTQISYPVKVK